MLAIYIRVSSDDQITASQDGEIKSWLSREGIDQDTIERYVDRGKTGKTMDRPAMDHLIEDVKSGKIEKIVVWRMDRLGRTAAGLTALFDLLTSHNVTLLSIRDGFDLATPSGRLMANVLASVAQFETEVRRERQMAGIAAAKDRGIYKGRPPNKAAYEKLARKALELKNRGFSYTEISKTMQVCKRTAIIYVQYARENHKKMAKAASDIAEYRKSQEQEKPDV